MFDKFVSRGVFADRFLRKRIKETLGSEVVQEGHNKIQFIFQLRKSSNIPSSPPSYLLVFDTTFQAT